jgi:hypothetical protein
VSPRYRALPEQRLAHGLTSSAPTAGIAHPSLTRRAHLRVLLGQTELATTTACRRALVATACGIGDIIRSTPLIRVLYHLGYTVDVLVAPQSAEAADLLRGAPEVARLLLALDMRPGGVAELAGMRYDVAAFTLWAAGFAREVVAGRLVSFPQDRWLREGDSACVEALARELGWTKPIPPPFAIASGRRFELPPGTIALHPGSNPIWPWKRWHGFDELAALLPSVVVVGTAEDADISPAISLGPRTCATTPANSRFPTPRR